MEVRGHGTITTGLSRHPLVVTALGDAVEVFVVSAPRVIAPTGSVPLTVDEAAIALKYPLGGRIGRWIRDSSNAASALGFNSDRYKHAIELVSQQPEGAAVLVRDCSAATALALVVGIAMRLAETGHATPPLNLVYPTATVLQTTTDTLDLLRSTVRLAMDNGCHMMRSSEIFVSLSQYT
tara:strand:- start:212 stop:751 length:540 start_codon:yes stop_codon:yes gene_type:complete